MEFLATAEIIPLDAAVLQSAADIEASFRLSGQDAIVLASVLRHLEAETPAESCFLNRNTKDFDDPDIRDRLEALHCKFFPNFVQALAYIAPRFRSEQGDSGAPRCGLDGQCFHLRLIEACHLCFWVQ